MDILELVYPAVDRDAYGFPGTGIRVGRVHAQCKFRQIVIAIAYTAILDIGVG